jgi:hypothetical protein
VARREFGVGPLRAAVGQLDRAEEFCFEPVGGLIVEPLVSLAEAGECDGEVVGGRAERIEQLLAGLRVGVAHGTSLVATRARARMA